MNRKPDGYRNMTPTELAELRQVQAETDSRNAEDDAQMAERKAAVVHGLVSYGFSEAGAGVLMSLIAQGVNASSGESYLNLAVQSGKIAFATREKAQAAQKAFDYYWRNHAN